MVQELLADLFGIPIAVGTINKLRQEMNQALEEPVLQVEEYVQRQAVIGVDETGFSQGNGDGKNPNKQKGWLWVIVSAPVVFFAVVLSRSQQTAKQLIGQRIKGIVITDRYSAYNWIEIGQRQLCWDHLKRDLTAIAQRSGASAQVGQALLKFVTWFKNLSNLT
jgi:hypothetical protein